MASSSSTTETCDTEVCPICHEKYCVPRSLSICGHVFCEKCLFSFVLKLKENGELGSNFQCPVCQEAHPVQESEQITLEWIKTFPLCEKHVVVNDESKILSSEDASTDNPCGPCEGTNITVPGEKYCKECRAYLCADCITIHKKFESLKSHKIIDETDPVVCENISVAVNQYAKCQIHPGRDIELYCKDKGEFLCFKCASTSHKDCTQDVDIVDGSDLNKVKVEGIQTRILKSQEHLRKLQSLSHENRKVINDQLETLIKEVETVRQNAIRSLDDIYENALARKKQLKINLEDRQFAITQSSEQLHREFEKKTKIMESILKHGSQVEIFATVENMEKDIDKLENDVLEFDTDFTVGEVDFAFTNELKATAEQFDPSKTCSISVTYNTGSHHPQFTSSLETLPYQIGKHVIHRIELNNNCPPTFTNIVQHDGTLLLCDNCSRECGYVCLYKTENKTKQKVKMNKPFCATFIDGETMAVTLPEDKTIAILSTGSEIRIKKSLKTNYVPKTIIALKNGKVGISWASPPGFSISDISGATVENKQYFTRDSDGRKFKYFDYMAIDERREHVIQPCKEDEAVYCFDYAAKPVFKYSNNIKKPYGVTVDVRRGSVFVCDRQSDSIHQLSSAGDPVKVIRHPELRSPIAICFDKPRNCIWGTKASSYYDVVCYLQN